MQWQWYQFDELTVDLLYDVMRLREIVFTLEQHVTCEDFDGLDKQAIHLVGTEARKVVAYARVLPPGVYKKDAASFGRLAIDKSLRGRGLGKQMMTKIVEYLEEKYPKTSIKFSAQLYLQRFYEGFGFEAYGEVYDEGGIPHIAMKNKS